MARFMERKSMNPKLRQDQTAKELCCSSETFQRHRQDINLVSPYRIPPNSNKGKKDFKS